MATEVNETNEDRFREIAEILQADGLPYEDIPEDIRQELQARAFEASSVCLDRLDSGASRRIRDYHKDRTRFARHIRRYWGKSLDQIHLFLNLVVEAGSNFNLECEPSAVERNDFRFEALRRLSARSCMLAGEILTLMEGGYASGALSRWRTLHEVAIVAVFLAKQPLEVSEKYLRHEVIEDCKAVEEYQKHHEKLGLEPYPQEELDRLTSHRDALCARFGQPFNNSNGWAAAALGKAKPTIKDLEEDAKLDHYRPLYRMASHDVHANPKGLKSILGLSLMPKDHRVMLAGPSEAGLFDPGQFLITTLCQIIETLLLSRATWERLVTIVVLKRFSEGIIASLASARDALTAEAAKKDGFANQ